MKTSLRIIAIMLIMVVSTSSRAQVFWTETFNNGCTAACLASTYTTGPNGAWVLTATGYNDPTGNKWFVSCAENGNAVGACGTACAGDATLHIGASNGYSTTDPGASYDAGGLCPTLWCVATDTRADSPTINCSGKTNITLSFKYMENGDGTTDNATLWYFNGTVWALLVDLPKTPLTCAPQGTWTAFTTTLPAICDNNPNVKLGFRWVNNDDGVGTDPSFAVDQITLSTTGVSVPTVSFTANDTTLCAGQCISFSGSATNGPILSWAWTFTGAATTSSNVQNPSNICYNAPGTYSVTLTATNATGQGTRTKTNYIVVTAVPNVVINPNVATICNGKSVTLTASGATTYSWAPATGLNTTNGATVIASPTTTTTYTITGTTNGCWSTNSVTVTVNPVPPTPVITLVGNHFVSSAAAGNQWYWNNGSLAGATAQNYTPLQNGLYYAIVTIGGCSSDTSNVINLTNIGIDESFGNNTFRMYPNPAEDHITIETSTSAKDAMLYLYTMQGQLLLQQAILKDKTNIDISKLSKGVYIVKLQSNTMGYVTRIVKE